MTRLGTRSDSRRRRGQNIDRPGAAISARRFWLVAVAAVAGALAWTYWPVLRQLWGDWQRDENYSVGQLVPLAALYLVYRDRHRLSTCSVSTCWWGLALVAGGMVIRLAGLALLYESIERYSLVLVVAGAVLLLAGRQVFGKLAWILLFLLLMVPLPGRVHNMISGPLQAYATSGAVFLLELAGMQLVREGNVLVLDERVSVAVAEACSGLRMLTAFIVVGAVLTYMVKARPWMKATLLLSSIPVAILCNVIRLFVTAELYLHAGVEWADKVNVHDSAGWVMMPLAVGLLAGELWLLRRLIIHDDEHPRKQTCDRSA